jgi:hypothetical protein
VVLCEHLTPELIRKPEYLRHPNGTTGVAGLVGVVDDVDRAERTQRRLLGDGAVRRDADGLTLTVPSGQAIELLTPRAFERRFGGAWPDMARVRSVLPVLRLAVRDLAQTQRHFESAQVPYQRTPGALRVGPEHTCGVLMQFEPRH